MKLSISFLILCVLVLMAQGIGKYVLSEEKDGRLPLRGTVQSPFGSSQQAVSPASPLQSHIAEARDD